MAVRGLRSGEMPAAQEELVGIPGLAVDLVELERASPGLPARISVEGIAW